MWNENFHNNVHIIARAILYIIKLTWEVNVKK